MASVGTTIDVSEPSAQRGVAATMRPTVETVIADHGPFVWRSARYLGVRDEDLADVVQDIFLVIHQRWDSFDALASTRTWIYGISLRVVSNYRRSLRRRKEDPTDSVPETAVSPEQPALLEAARTRAALQRALDELDETDRAVFVLFEIEQLPMTEVARVVGRPVRTAYARLEAAREQLRRSCARAMERSRR